MTSEQDQPEAAPKAPRRRPQYKRIRVKDSWLRDRYDPTEEKQQAWLDAGFPEHVDVIAGFLMSNNLIFGIPEKAEVFRLAELTKEDAQSFSPPDRLFEDSLNLRCIKPSPIPAVYYTMAHSPIGERFSDMVEVNYNVRLQALICQMHLTSIRIISGSATDDDPKIVFEGTEYPGPAIHRRIRVVRVTVLAPGIATWEAVSETTYPKSIF